MNTSPRASWLSVSCGVSTLLFAPKCPLCLAAYLALGASSAALSALAWLRPAAALLAAFGCGGLLLTWLRARRARASADARLEACTCAERAQRSSAS
jgi:hypothetical protein